MTQDSLFSAAEINDLDVKEIDRDVFILDENLLNALEGFIIRSGSVAFDIETTGLEKNSELVGIGLAWKDKDPNSHKEVICDVYIPVGHVTQIVQLRIDIVLNFLKRIFQKVEVLVFNAGFELKVMRRYNIEIPYFYDVRHDAVCINENYYRESLKDLAKAYLGMEWGTIKEISSRKVKVRNEKGKLVTKSVVDVAGTSIERLGKYCREDCVATLKLRDLFKKQVAYAEKIIQLERKVAPAVIEMEERGIRIDIPVITQMLEETKKKITDLEYIIYNAAGRPFNLNSPKQVSTVLFDELKLHSPNGRSTDVNTLQELKDDHMVPNLMLQYRDLEKLRGTYLEPLLSLQIDGRIYTSLNQLGTESGRFSSNKPNMQNQPADPEFRRIFIPSEGMIFLDCDYSQIEGRVFAHVSQDKILLDYYRNGGDIHTATSEKLGIPRKLAKVINFAIIYGCAPKKLSETMQKEGFKYDIRDAKELIKNFWSAYSGGYKWVKGFKDELHRNKYIYTTFGRRRLFPDLDGADEYSVYAMEREAVNFAVQGAAADIMKFALVDVNEALKIAKHPAYMLLQVHDELLFEGFPERKEEAQRIIEHRMRDAVLLSIPLEVELKSGINWAEVH